MKVLSIAVFMVAVQVYSLLASPSLKRDEEMNDILPMMLESDEELEAIVGSDREIIIRDAIIKALGDLRSGMETGFPELGVLPLDPLVVPNIPFNVTFDDNMVFGNLTDSELVNLSNFVISQVLVHIQFALFVNLGLETENWELHGTYSMGGHALGLDVFGNGNYHITLNDVQFALYVFLGLGHWGKYIEVKDLTADLMLTNADVQFENIMGGGIEGALINEALSAELPIILKDLEDAVLPPLFEVLKNKTNEYLMEFPLYPDFNITDVDDWSIYY